MEIVPIKKRVTQLNIRDIAIPIFEDRPLELDLDREIQEEINHLRKSGVFRGEVAEEYTFHYKNRNISFRILLSGLGRYGEITDERLRLCGCAISRSAQKKRIREICLLSSHLREVSHLPLLEGMLLGSYRFTRYKKEDDVSSLRKVYVSGTDLKRIDIKDARLINDAVSFARDLVNTPSNELTPTELLRTARTLRGKMISISSFTRRQARDKGLNAFVAVSMGSHEEPRFIVIKYRGGGKKRVALIGKSITFDSGGISLKPSEGMEKMKYDMAGGAAVLAVLRYLRESRLPINVIAILPATENLPGGSATRPGDIVRAYNGKTIEIINTDAEGRLTLADAISYAKKYRPDVIIDIATLTGACSVALGNEAMALMSNNEDIVSLLKRTSEKTGERIWQMPLYDEYREYLKSDVADIKNTGGRTGSLVTAGYFLKEFAGDTPWVHLDIASTAWVDKDRPCCPKGATGVAVRLTIEFLKEYIS